jgi:putative ABC transport system permease protein
MNDLKFAFRQLAKKPGFTAIAVLTLALGVGATTAMFSVVNAVMLRPLPYAEPDRLVRIYTEFPGFPNGGLRRFSVSAPEYLDLRRETRSWEIPGSNLPSISESRLTGPSNGVLRP